MIRITDDDLKIFELVNMFGIVDKNNIVKFYELSAIKKTDLRITRRIYELIEHKYLERIIYPKKLLFCGGKDISTRYIGKNVNYAKLNHTLYINNVYLYLLQEYKNFWIKTEHEMKQDNHKFTTIIPDLILKNDNEDIWIEVELNAKSKDKTKKRLLDYSQKTLRKEIKSVYYFTNTMEVVNLFRKLLGSIYVNLSLFIYDKDKDIWLKVAENGKFII